MSTEQILLAVVVLLLLGLAVAIALLFQLRKSLNQPKDDSTLRLMSDWMQQIKTGTEATRENMEQNISKTNRDINERLDNAAKVIGGLQARLGEMSQIGPDIRRLSEVLASPKARGNFGEEMLEILISQVLPQQNYQSQYRFRNGEVVDMILRVGDRILPIDSKFSLENFIAFKEAKTDSAAETFRKAFVKDVKKRIDEIAKKYILTQEATFDFALMYVQSEPVLMEALNDAELVSYSRNKKVYWVSPNTLYHHLQIILISLKGQQINSVAEKILHQVSSIKQESDKFGRNLGVLSNHIKNAGNTMGTVVNDFTKLQTSIYNTADLKLESEAAPAKVLTKAPLAQPVTTTRISSSTNQIEPELPTIDGIG